MALSRRSSSLRTFARGPRRQTSWNGGPRGASSANTASVTLFATGIQSLEDGITHVRLRGELSVQVVAAAASQAGFSRIAAGVCIVSENASGVGITALPDPIADVGWDGWLWYWTGSVFATSVIGDGGFSAESDGVRVTIDSKAMRKWKRTDVMVGIFATDDEVGDATLLFKLNTRCLAKIA